MMLLIIHKIRLLYRSVEIYNCEKLEQRLDFFHLWLVEVTIMLV